MAFTDQQKIDIRRHLGYPLYGGQPVQAFGWRFFQWYGTLEFRMDNLSPEEETMVTKVYLDNLNELEAAIPAASANLDTDEAAVWRHNRQEVQDRLELYDVWRRKLAQLFGVPLRDRDMAAMRFMV